MTREDVLNRIALKEYSVLFNEIPALTDRVYVLNAGLNEVLKLINDLSLADVRLSFPSREDCISEKNLMYEKLKMNEPELCKLSFGYGFRFCHDWINKELNNEA